jgi:hypothetical protein
MQICFGEYFNYRTPTDENRRTFYRRCIKSSFKAGNVELYWSVKPLCNFVNFVVKNLTTKFTKNTKTFAKPVLFVDTGKKAQKKGW